jgi:hypothetical protein
MIIENKLLYPNYLSVANLFSQVLKSETDELAALDELMNGLLNEITPNCTSKWLSDWEQLLEIENSEAQTEDERQSTIVSKLRSSGTLTHKRLKEIALSFNNGEVEIKEDHEKCQITLKFVGEKGIPSNFYDFKTAMAETQPAHLEVVYEITYNTRGYLEGFTRGRLNNYLRGDLRVVEIT